MFILFFPEFVKNLKNFEVGAHFGLLTIKVNGPMGQKYNMFA